MTPFTWSAALYRAIEAGLRRDVLAVCVAHDGAHVYYLNGCHGGPAPGRSRWERYLTSHDPSPEPPPPIRVEIDEERLASAIVAASQATRDARRLERRERGATAGVGRSPAYDPPRPEEPTEERDTAPTRAIPTVTVWSPGMDDGASE